MKITFYAHTAQGKRQEQQDSFLVLDFPTTGQQIAAVADGMGGHPKGLQPALQPLTRCSSCSGSMLPPQRRKPSLRCARPCESRTTM